VSNDALGSRLPAALGRRYSEFWNHQLGGHWVLSWWHIRPTQTAHCHVSKWFPQRCPAWGGHRAAAVRLFPSMSLFTDDIHYRKTCDSPKWPVMCRVRR